ncbi:hypothetical protein [Alicyclobacillus dauci]|uniref:Uncharacterized protein n=1 Tax=Alicyclobacillus dauci TaxID=1475485 RepID=A0ABY6Z2U8_9BACL|nr:hypothetical protein [Alicyclobacillus dauci]WAH36614.1 hypothetical protein NZD86_20925 [Alicyclobacillus dauci]
MVRRTQLMWSVILAIAVWGLYQIWAEHATSQEPDKNYVLPNDNFDSATMNTIHSDLNQYSVSQEPLDHEVYILTGGIGTANPRLMGWDSIGNMMFAKPDSPETFDFRQESQSPSTWETERQSKGVLVSEGSSSGMKPVPWVKKTTKSGRIYFQWDELPGITQFYFEQGHTYIVLVVGSASGNASFPSGVMTHLQPVGNPVIRN